MHVLITSDTVGGVWTYTQELVTELAHRGHRITLVSLGKLPLPHQTAWMKTLAGVDYRPTEYRLEWMEVAERDIEESKRYLELLISEVEPDVLHFSQYCYGSLDVRVPKIVVAHSDIVSWWVAVHGCEPDDTPWMRNYRETVTSGLRGADAVIAPSAWMLEQLSKFYFKPKTGFVIYNGRTPALLDPNKRKEDFVLCVGRVWDPAKGMSLILERELEAGFRVVGWEREPGREDRKRNLHVPKNVQLLGQRSHEQLRDLYARAGIYAATSRYEPFGLAPLEAALSRCALVLNDNAVFHELWEEAGVFFAKDDAADLARVIAGLGENAVMRDSYAERAYELARDRFTATQMAEHYEQLYAEITSTARVA
jgi:glycosyltransferase involved in cell wall biosynthesis